MEPWSVFPLGAVRLGRCEHINRTSVRIKTTGPSPCRRGGLCPVLNKLWYGSFVVRTWSNPTARSIIQCFTLDTCPLRYGSGPVFAPPPAVRKPPPVAFWVTMAQYGRQLARLRSSRDNHMITHDHSCVIKTAGGVPKGLIEELVFVSFLRLVCWCQHGMFYFEM